MEKISSCLQDPLTDLVGKDDRCFVEAQEFVPERWTDRPDLIKDASVYIPFQSGMNFPWKHMSIPILHITELKSACLGKYACAGKQLALLELREVTARIVDQYDFTFATGKEEARFLAGRSDGFGVTYTQPLDLIFSRRV